MPAIIAIGASEGGFEAIRTLAAALPAGFPAALLVVLHIGTHPSQLLALLNLSGPLPASHALDGEAICPGHIYVAPPDRHLVIEDGRLQLNRGPRENWARPAIDPLFRTAAQAYGQDVVGVILTGGLNDGTAGLFEIKRRGGITIVQDPADAVNPSMPRSALQHVEVDHRTTLAGLPALLMALVGDLPANRIDADPTRSTAMTSEARPEYQLDTPIAITCPDCGGALRRTELGTLTQFRCHIGHVYTAEVVVAAQFEALESALVVALRAIGERAELCRQMAGQSRDADDPGAAAWTAAAWTAAMIEARERSAIMQELLSKGWTNPTADPA